MNIILLGNALSFIASVIMILMGFIKKRDRFLIAQCGMNAFFIAGNLCLGGISGAIANAVTMTRNIVCLKWNLSRALKLFFIALQIGLVLLTGTDSLIMWLPIIGNCVFTWYMDTEDMALLKGIVIGSQFLWGIYDFYIMNYATVPFDAGSCITNAVAMAAILRSRKRSRFPSFDLSEWAPVIRSSICSGEKTAGMKNRSTGRFREIMLIHSEDDIREFCQAYGVDREQIETIY